MAKAMKIVKQRQSSGSINGGQPETRGGSHTTQPCKLPNMMLVYTCILLEQGAGLCTGMYNIPPNRTANSVAQSKPLLH